MLSKPETCNGAKFRCSRDPSNRYISIIKAIFIIKLNDMDNNIDSSNGYILIIINNMRWRSKWNSGIAYSDRPHSNEQHFHSKA